MTDAPQNPADLRELALKLVTLRHMQDQRHIQDRTLEHKLGVRDGSMTRMYAGDPGYTYLVDRVDQAISDLSRKGKRMASDARARRELDQYRRSGEWIDANRFVELVEQARGGFNHRHMLLEQLMQERPFFGEGE